MDIAAHLVLFAAHHQHNFGVGFQPENSIDDVNTSALQLPGPLDVVVFVKPRLELHQGHHLLAILRGSDQRRNDG